MSGRSDIQLRINRCNPTGKTRFRKWLVFHEHAELLLLNTVRFDTRSFPPWYAGRPRPSLRAICLFLQRAAAYNGKG